MAKSMTTSPMTSGQIDRACDILRAKLTKHASEFSSGAVQLAFGQSELSAEWLAIFRKFVEMFSSMIVRHVKVDRSRSSEQVIDATGRVKYVDGKVVKSMPRGTGEEKDIHFFKPAPEEYDHDGWMSDEAFEVALARRKLIATDPYSLAKVNEDDPSFADEHPNSNHWKDADDKWCFVAFRRWRGERCVIVGRDGGDWDDGWWLAGVASIVVGSLPSGELGSLGNIIVLEK